MEVFPAGGHEEVGRRGRAFAHGLCRVWVLDVLQRGGGRHQLSWPRSVGQLAFGCAAGGVPVVVVPGALPPLFELSHTCAPTLGLLESV